MVIQAMHRCCFKVNVLFHLEFARSRDRRWSTPISRDEKVSSEFASRSNHLKCLLCTSCHWHQGISSWDDYEVADWLENYWIVLRKQYVLSLRCLRNSKRDLRGWMFRSDNWCLGKNLKLLGVDLVSSFLDQHSNSQNGDKRNLKPTANMWYSWLSAARDQYRTPCPKLLCISQRRRGRILFRPTLSVWCPSKRKVKHFGVERSTWFNIYKNHWSHCITGLVSCTPLYPQVSTGCIALPEAYGEHVPGCRNESLCLGIFFKCRKKRNLWPPKTCC